MLPAKVPQSMDDIYDEAAGRLFPKHLLEDCESALFLFGAGFYGANDACWAVEAGVHGTVVDIDQEKLLAMAFIYPIGWEFVHCDAFDFCNRHQTDKWDFVSIDCPTELMEACAKIDWWQWTRKAFIITQPEGDDFIRRTDETGWSIYEI